MNSQELRAIEQSFGRFKRRLKEQAGRIQDLMDWKREAQRRLPALIVDPLAIPAAPGSPIFELQQIVTAKITAAGANPGEYTATVRRSVGDTHGHFENDPDLVTAITVKSLPVSGDGTQDHEFISLPVGAHVHVRWEGGSADGSEQFYHFVGFPGGKIAARVQSVDYDHLVVRLNGEGGVLGDENIYVAKSEELRRSPFSPNTTGDGKTYTYASPTQRTVSQGGTSETQVIVPAYRIPSGAYKGSLIFISPVVGGSTDVEVGGNKVHYVHQDARAWAKQ